MTRAANGPVALSRLDDTIVSCEAHGGDVSDDAVLAIDYWPTNGHLIADLARIGYLRREWRTLDPTYGYGTFWGVWQPDELVACDLLPEKSPIGYSVDFTALPFENRSFDAVVYDPPYKLNGTPSDTGGVDERFGVDGERYTRWQDRMTLIRAGARECARVTKTMLLVKCQDQVVSSKVRWQTKAVADEVEPLGFGLRARFDFLGGREQPGRRTQKNPRSRSSQLLVFQRGWKWEE